MILALGVAQPLPAHAVGADWKIRGDRVDVEVFFDDDTPGRQARIKVRDDANKVVVDGQADDKGMWSFPRPNPGRYQIRVDAGAGHLAVVTLIVPPHPSAPDAGSAADAPPSAGAAPGAAAGARPRAEFTRTPWLAMVAGLLAIAVVSLLFRAFLRLVRTSAAP